MSVVEKIKSAVGLDDDVTTYQYRCDDCDARFESAKTPDRATCPECVSKDTELLEER